MILTIDTTQKTIIINEDVNVKELIDELNEMFPKGAWALFKIIHRNPMYITDNTLDLG